jgi:hypothetical protein
VDVIGHHLHSNNTNLVIAGDLFRVFVSASQLSHLPRSYGGISESGRGDIADYNGNASPTLCCLGRNNAGPPLASSDTLPIPFSAPQSG